MTVDSYFFRVGREWNYFGGEGIQVYWSVRCVPPARYRMGGFPDRDPSPWTETPLRHRPPPRHRPPLRQEPPLDRDPPVDRQTPLQSFH